MKLHADRKKTLQHAGVLGISASIFVGVCVLAKGIHLSAEQGNYDPLFDTFMAAALVGYGLTHGYKSVKEFDQFTGLNKLGAPDSPFAQKTQNTVLSLSSGLLGTRNGRKLWEAMNNPDATSGQKASAGMAIALPLLFFTASILKLSILGFPDMNDPTKKCLGNTALAAVAAGGGLFTSINSIGDNILGATSGVTLAGSALGLLALGNMTKPAHSIHPFDEEMQIPHTAGNSSESLSSRGRT